jgi:hypothetical protein
MQTGMCIGVDTVSRGQRLVKSHATRRSVTSERGQHDQHDQRG